MEDDCNWVMVMMPAPVGWNRQMMVEPMMNEPRVLTEAPMLLALSTVTLEMMMEMEVLALPQCPWPQLPPPQQTLPLSTRRQLPQLEEYQGGTSPHPPPVPNPQLLREGLAVEGEKDWEEVVEQPEAGELDAGERHGIREHCTGESPAPVAVESPKSRLSTAPEDR